MLNPWVIGADLGGTKIELGLVDPENQVVARRRIATEAEKGPDHVVNGIAGSVGDLRAALPSGAKIAALAICSPGPLDHESGVLMDPPNLRGLHNTPLRQMLEDRLQMPVALEHDAKAAALGELNFGAGRGASSMVYIVVGTGVGAAIILDGNMVRGEHNFAGEVGHITIDRYGELCHCGSRGCAETFISGPSLAKRYRQAMENEGSAVDARPISGEFVSELAAQGDHLAETVMQAAGEALGLVVASLAMTVNVDLYVIGGSVVNAGDLLLEPARRTVPHYTFQSVGDNVRIVAAGLGGVGPVLGCAWLARQIDQEDLLQK
ncbi:MAG: ROK family protein [Chloroflexota bacterium]|nr:ROK family protein [Chloroflexota bacterium]